MVTCNFPCRSIHVVEMARKIFGTSGDSKYTYHWVNYSDVNLAPQNGKCHLKRNPKRNRSGGRRLLVTEKWALSSKFPGGFVVKWSKTHWHFQVIRNSRCGLKMILGSDKKIGHTAIRQQFPDMISLIWETVPTRKSAMDVKLVVKHHRCHSSIMGAQARTCAWRSRGAQWRCTTVCFEFAFKSYRLRWGCLKISQNKYSIRNPRNPLSHLFSRKLMNLEAPYWSWRNHT